MSLEATCSCHRVGCNALLAAVRVGRDVLHVDTQAHADGEVALFAGDYLRVTPEHEPRTRFTIKASQIGMAMRYRIHDMHCDAVGHRDPSKVKTRDIGPRIRRQDGR